MIGCFWHRGAMKVRPAVPADRDWVAGTLVSRWGSTEIVTMGRRCDASVLDALVALDAAGNRVGLLTYRIDGDGLEVVTIDALGAASRCRNSLARRRRPDRTRCRAAEALARHHE